ncbi:REP-associated tyrosine transposase [Capilliphycus salinus ALCB114379]|uniref:REP-associated tyrosine transposase n=1 Tax=Capilliphycus salinus TaxID=2768948 RepID=UPI0039A774A8
MYQYRHLTPEQKAEILQYRKQQGFPPHSPPHPVQDQQFYLLSAACYEHKPRINTLSRRQEILNQLFTHFIEAGSEILAWVILANHYHLLVENIEFKKISEILRFIHGRLARQWNLEDNLTGKVWYSYSDRAIRSERHYYATLNYIHYNPVKHNYVKSPYDWETSSVHWYLQEKGRDWLRSCWVEYPVRDYGKGWDDLS